MKKTLMITNIATLLMLVGYFLYVNSNLSSLQERVDSAGELAESWEQRAIQQEKLAMETATEAIQQRNYSQIEAKKLEVALAKCNEK